MALGLGKNGDMLGVPAHTLFFESTFEAVACSWRACTVIGYDEDNRLYSIKYDDADAVGVFVPRIHLLFYAEDPAAFAARAAAAIEARRRTEASIGCGSTLPIVSVVNCSTCEF